MPKVSNNLHPGDPSIQHSAIPVSDGLIHVARVGQGRPLLLLHGWPEFWFTWEPVMLRLADRFDVIAPDLRGFGDSSKPDGPFGAAQHAADLFAVLDQLGLEQVSLVSHDLGGAVAQAMAQVSPERLRGLFFFDFMHPGIGPRFFTPDRFQDTWYMFFNQLPLASNLAGATQDSVRQYITYFLRDWAHRKNAFDDVFEIFVENFAKPGNLEGGFAYYKAAIPPRTNPQHGGSPPPPPPVHIPTCVRWSEHDKLFPYAWTDTLADFFPNLDLGMFEGVGHFPHREDPAMAARYIRDFFLSQEGDS